MAKKRSRERKQEPMVPHFSIDLSPSAIRGIWIVAFAVLGIFLILAAIHNAGVVGEWTYTGLTALLGVGYFLLPLLLFALAILFIRPREEKAIGLARMFGAGLFFFAGLALIDLLFDTKGGLLGNTVTTPMIALFDYPATLVLVIAFLVIAFLLLFSAQLHLFSPALWRKPKELGVSEAEVGELKVSGQSEEPDEGEDEPEREPERRESSPIPAPAMAERMDAKKDVEAPAITFPPTQFGTYTPPPVSLLEKDKGRAGTGDIKANANLIKRTLQNFGIQVEMDEVSIGPSVTRYALKPAEGVRLSKILGLQNNLELALAASPVRIEAPIPGKSLVGIEIPNTAKATIGLSSLLSQAEFQNSPKPLLMALGKDIAGRANFANLAKMPHLLIAGATGSGKSVTIHALITSLLYRNGPAQMRFIMVDPKRVELTLYNNIPHLLTPVITDAKKAILALKWAAKEMDRRYDILQTQSVRDIESYHQNVLAPALKASEKDGDDASLPEAMPYIVIVIDELADIMQTYPRELEAAIVRLAQMSRAVGIHLVLSTQRPSVNVITGLIKANVPARIALQVASFIDSRTILDMGGAEKLLGAGDMLYLSGDMAKPTRIQSAFITEAELKRVTTFIKENNMAEGLDTVDLAGSAENASNAIFAAALSDDDAEGDNDELYEEAREIVCKAGKASTSYLQRRLRVGYARAARLMDLLEERGVIGPADGAKPREVLGSTSSSDSEEPM